MNKGWLASLSNDKAGENQNLFFLLMAWTSGLVVWFTPQIGVWFIAITLLFWIYRVIKEPSLITRNPVTIPITIFLLTALVGVWAAFDQQAAFHKYLIVLAAVLIFYALADFPVNQSHQVFGLAALTASLLAVYFLLSQDWQAQPADFGWINQVGLAWMQVRYSLPSIFDNANIPAGILAVLLPLIIVLVGQAHINNKPGWKYIGWISILVVVLAIVMSSSRAVWGALIVGLVTWMWWRLSSTNLISQKRRTAKIFLLGFVAIGIVFFLFLVRFIAQVDPSEGIVIGQSSAFSRITLYHQTTDLIADFWLTGGGLQSFAGLYSEYILNIPYLFYVYAHNLVLDITLEQGIFGIISFITIYLLIAVILVKGVLRIDRLNRAQQGQLTGLLVSMLILWGHGLVDDALYGVQGTPFLFIVPGIVVGHRFVFGGESGSEKMSKPQSIDLRKKTYALGMMLVGCILLVLILIPPVRSAVQANFAAIQMAKIELANFPSGSFDDHLSANDFASEKNILLEAIKSDPDQRTANHCLGRIALQAGEYESAANFLKIAHKKDPNHTGIRKTLGYTYVWLGEFDEAYGLIHTYPEAESEMANYSTWWNQNGNDVLSANAYQMYEYLRTDK